MPRVAGWGSIWPGKVSSTLKPGKHTFCLSNDDSVTILNIVRGTTDPCYWVGKLELPYVLPAGIKLVTNLATCIDSIFGHR